MSEAQLAGCPDSVDRPLVSVVTIFLDAARFLPEAIESVLQQTYSNWELLLVDDGSSDGSSRIARECAKQHRERVRYLEHPGHENRGMSAARNLGLQYSTGRYIALLDADDRWAPTKLEQQIEELRRFPDADMVYGRTLYWNSWQGAGVDAIQPHGISGGRVWDSPELLTLFLNGDAAVPCTCSLLIRKAAADAVAGFEESFRGLYEDQVFYAKVCLEHRVLVSDKCLDWYRQHPDSACTKLAGSDAARRARSEYLAWLTAYVEERGICDDALLRALQREAWRARTNALAPLPTGFERRLRNWILGVEARLPEFLRRRIWSAANRGVSDCAAKPSG